MWPAYLLLFLFGHGIAQTMAFPNGGVWERGSSASAIPTSVGLSPITHSTLALEIKSDKLKT